MRQAQARAHLIGPAAARFAAMFAVALALHASLALLLGGVHPRTPATATVPLEVALVEKPRPAPPAQPEPPKPAPVKLARARPAPRPPLSRPARESTATDAPPPPSIEAQRADEKPVVLSGITLESTTPAGGFAAPVGNTLYGEPPRTAAEPRAARPYKAERYVASASVNELPSVTYQPDLRDFYPPEAKRLGFEADVVLRLLIDGDGSLAKVEVISDPGQGLAEAAQRAIRLFRFAPAKVSGQPVATSVPFTMKFELK